MSIRFVDKNKLNSTIRKVIKPARIVLDIGCGINPQKIIKPKVHICIEPYIEYIQKLLSKKQFNNYVYINSSWDDALKLFPNKSVDSIFLLDFIEHISKEDGVKLIEECERIAKQQIILFTPLGFLPQTYTKGEKDAWGLDGISFQEHKSGWVPDEFDESWDSFCVNEFHFVNERGMAFEKPYGAFFAIKNITSLNNNPTMLDYFLLSLKKYTPNVIIKILKKISKVLFR